MNKITKSNVQGYCRVCMDALDEFPEYLDSVIREFSKIFHQQDFVNENLPRNICPSCSKKIVDFYKFCCLAEESYDKFMVIIKEEEVGGFKFVENQLKYRNWVEIWRTLKLKFTNNIHFSRLVHICQSRVKLFSI